MTSPKASKKSLSQNQQRKLTHLSPSKTQSHRKKRKKNPYIIGFKKLLSLSLHRTPTMINLRASKSQRRRNQCLSQETNSLTKTQKVRINHKRRNLRLRSNLPNSFREIPSRLTPKNNRIRPQLRHRLYHKLPPKSSNLPRMQKLNRY